MAKQWYLKRIVPEGNNPVMVQLKEGMNKLGRAATNDVRCLSLEVSREHCFISVGTERITVLDNGSFNGTYIGDAKIPKLREVSLVDGDIIGLGSKECFTMQQYVFQLTCTLMPDILIDPVKAYTQDCVKKRCASTEGGPPRKVCRGSSSPVLIDLSKEDLPSNSTNPFTEHSKSTISDNFQNPTPNESVGKFSAKTHFEHSEGVSGSLEATLKPSDTSWRHFSQIDEEDIVVISDSDEEFPNSQLFDRIPQEVFEDEKENSINLCDDESSDSDILEDDVSFFENHFSQLSELDCDLDMDVGKEGEGSTEERTEKSLKLEDKLKVPEKSNSIKDSDINKIPVIIQMEDTHSEGEKQDIINARKNQSVGSDETIVKNKLKSPSTNLDTENNFGDKNKNEQHCDISILNDETNKKQFMTEIENVQKSSCSGDVKYPNFDADTKEKKGDSSLSELTKGNCKALKKKKKNLNAAEAKTETEKQICDKIQLKQLVVKLTSNDEKTAKMKLQSDLRQKKAKFCEALSKPKEKKKGNQKKETQGPGLTKEEKNLIAEERKMKLKLLTVKEKTQGETQDTGGKPTKEKDESKTKLPVLNCVKITERNRGSFLTEGISLEETNNLKNKKESKTNGQNEKEISGRKENCKYIEKNKSKSRNNKQNFLKNTDILHNNDKSREELDKQVKNKLEHNNCKATNKKIKGHEEKASKIEHQSRKNSSDHGRSSRSKSKSIEEDKEKNRIVEAKSAASKNNKKSGHSVTRSKSKENHSATPHTSCLVAKQQSATELKKRGVRFAEGNDLVHVKYFECEGLLKKISQKIGKELYIAPPKLEVKTYVEGIPLSDEEIIYQMCKWSTKWIDESDMFEEDPPLIEDGFHACLKDEYVSFNDYFRSFYGVLIQEFWAGLIRDFKMLPTNSLFGGIKGKSKYTIKTHSGDTMKMMEQLHCCLLLSTNDVKNNQFPKKGDYIILQIITKNISEIDGFEKNVGNCQSLFGYIYKTTNLTKFNTHRDSFVHDISKQFCSSPLAKESLASGLHSVTYFSLMIRLRREEIKEGSKIRIKVIRSIQRDLRNFEALARLPFSPLSPMVINPRGCNFEKPEIAEANVTSQFPLNESQKAAVLGSVNSVMRNLPMVNLIHGPPGTGKTHVIISIILQILYSRRPNNHKQNKVRILLCAPSNAALDEIVIRLMDTREHMPPDKKFKLVRNGRKKTMHPKVSTISSESLAFKDVTSNSDPETIQLELSVLKATERAIASQLENSKQKEKKTAYMQHYSKIQEQIMFLEKLMKNQCFNENDRSPQMRKQLLEAEVKILQHAEIVASTLSSCFSTLMQEAFGTSNMLSQNFCCCIVDEATQCIEPETLLPLLLNVNNFILVGDPQQLPATVLSKSAKEKGLEKSLFGRFSSVWNGLKSPNKPLYLLNTQFRMHPEIIKWPSLYFYHGKVTTSPFVAQFAPTPLVPYVILSHTMGQDSYGESNSREGLFVSQLVSKIHQYEPCKNLNIGVVVPYQKQRSFIIQVLEASSLRKPELVSVQTIDSYQGQERDVVVVSCVRTDGIGFLADPHRLNVALTRAKFSLIIVANFVSLKGNNAWNSLLEDAKKRGKIMHIPRNFTPDDLLELVLT